MPILIILLTLSLTSLTLLAQPQKELSGPQAFEMVIIQGVSHTAKTFVTKTGRDMGLTEGQEASFNTENFALVARAKLVTKEYTVWEVLEPGGTIPFEKNKIVVMNRAKENIWELIPKQEKLTIYKQNLIYRGAMGIGLTQSISNVEVGKNERSLIQGDILYEMLLSDNFSLAVGGRLEREAQVSEAITILTDRLYALLESTYHFARHESLRETHLYATLSVGLGYSRSNVDGDKQLGYAYLIPGTKLGLEHSMGRKSSFLLEAGLDSVATREYILYRGAQDTNAVNAKIGVGFKSYF